MYEKYLNIKIQQMVKYNSKLVDFFLYNKGGRIC